MREAMAEIKVSALVSTWSAERFMRGLLEDLEQQSIAEQLEIVVVDSNSPQAEGRIVEEFQGRYPNIRYYRTPFRENSHATLNRAIQLARGEYLTVANTDDRHRFDAFALMASALDECPDVGIVYPDTLIGTVPNESFANCTATTRHDWPDYNHNTVLSCCLFGALPMWRRSVHAEIGAFDPELVIAGDHDLYSRISLRFGAIHVRESLGIFLQRADSNSGADNREATIREVMQVMRRLRSETPLEQLFPSLAGTDDPDARAAALFELGNLCALGPYNDAEAAFQCYQQAGEILESCASGNTELQFALVNNLACLCAGAGIFDAAFRLLSQAGGDPRAESLRGLIADAAQGNEGLALQRLPFAQPGHEVIRDSRRAHGLRLLPDGGLQRTLSVRVPWDVFEGPNGVPVSPVELGRAKAGLAGR
jgi:hypothetical protein